MVLIKGLLQSYRTFNQYENNEITNYQYAIYTGLVAEIEAILTYY